MSIIRIVCMYCDKEYGTKDGHGTSGVSHGICPTCLNLTDDDRDDIARAKSLKRFSEFGK